MKMLGKSSALTRVHKMPPKLRLKLANECENLLSRVKLKSLMKQYKFHLLHSKHIDQTNFNKMMDLFEPLMRDMYEKSSWGWNDREKMSEWKHSRTRVILVTKNDHLADNISFNELPQEEDGLVGFMCFRFESGADKNECALYVYELHIHQEFQRQGLGEELMRMAINLALEFKMDKVMLTVFRTNSKALQFYNKLKFAPDKSTPAKNEADYIILSTKLKY